MLYTDSEYANQNRLFYRNLATHKVLLSDQFSLQDAGDNVAIYIGHDSGASSKATSTINQVLDVGRVTPLPPSKSGCVDGQSKGRIPGAYYLIQIQPDNPQGKIPELSYSKQTFDISRGQHLRLVTSTCERAHRP